MAWDPPTVDQFTTRFPEFATIDEALIETVLDEAIGEVGTSWVEKDRTPAVLHLAAHFLAQQSYGVQNSGGGLPPGAPTGAIIKRRKVGDVEIEFDVAAKMQAPGSGALGSYQSTHYGRRYLELKRRNFPAVAIV